MRHTLMRNSKSHQSNKNNDYANIMTYRANSIWWNEYAKTEDYFEKWLAYIV